MTVQIRNLMVFGYGNGVTLWSYRCPQSCEIDTPGYFNPAAEMMKQGDMIMVSGATRGAIRMVTKATHEMVVLGEVD